jgi:MazG family protein
VTTVSIAGIDPGAGTVPAPVLRRLLDAAALVVPCGSRAAAALAAAGLTTRSYGELGLPAAPCGEELVVALRAAAGDGEAILVLDAPLPLMPLDTHPSLGELVRIMTVLRDPEDGCPWDLEQTHETLKPNIIEEAYEVVDAIDSGVDSELAEELGDVLLQIAFHSQMAAEAGTFSIDDVADGIVAKLVYRHPHIFGDVEAGTAEETLQRWDQLKRVEKAHRESALDGIPSGLPALMASQKISRRVVALGFEWDDTEGVYAKVAEEIDELRATVEGSPEAAEELGDLLFTVVNLARRYGVDAEQALRAMNEKFSRRWRHMEKAAEAAGTPVGSIDAARLEELWNDAKRDERAADA